VFTKFLCCSMMVFVAIAMIGIWLQKVRRK
jgi:hypothetical protein